MLFHDTLSLFLFETLPGGTRPEPHAEISRSLDKTLVSIALLNSQYNRSHRRRTNSP